MTGDRWQVTCDRWQVTRDTCSSGLGLRVFGRYFEQRSIELNNQSMNHRGDCRTAPATPGLLKSIYNEIQLTCDMLPSSYGLGVKVVWFHKGWKTPPKVDDLPFCCCWTLHLMNDECVCQPQISVSITWYRTCWRLVWLQLYSPANLVLVNI